MKRIITLALSAMLLCLSAEAQKNIYHIDGKPAHVSTRGVVIKNDKKIIRSYNNDIRLT